MSEVDVKEEDCKKTKLDRILEGIGVLVFVILFMIILYVGHYIMLHATFILAPERIAQKFNLPVFYVKLLWPIFLFICFLILGAFSYIFCENKGYKSKKIIGLKIGIMNLV